MPGRVIIRPDAPPRFTPSGLILPDSALEKKPPTQLGTVAAVPADSEEWLDAEDRCEVGVGARVLFRREGRELDGCPDLIAVGCNNVLAVVEEE